MNNSLTVSYPAGSEDQIKIQYAINLADGMQTINCSIISGRFPSWLQLRKFSISSVEDHGSYTKLYNEVNDSKNLDTSLFIDLVYSSIMRLKQLKYL